MDSINKHTAPREYYNQDNSIAATPQDEEVIIAPCTPKGAGSIALIRLSGTDAITIADTIAKLASGSLLNNVPTHTIHYGWVVDEAGNHIDQVMFILMRGPKTFTGQDVIEISCHNNPFIIEQIIQCALNKGARLAQPGEFAQRAVLNGKMDLLQAEAINELIHANTAQALKHSLAQLEGSFSHWIMALEQELIKALALSDASFEFIDEEMGFGEAIQKTINEVLAKISIIKQSFDQQKQIREGVRIALIGSVNAGKSSLFNALLRTKRAIVTPIAGTTRDVIEAGIYKNNSYLTLVDTAGLRTTDDIIEQEGIARSREQAHAADIILLVIDSARAMHADELLVYQELLHAYHHKIIVVFNKADLPTADQAWSDDAAYRALQAHEPRIAASCIQPESIESLDALLVQKIESLLTAAQTPFLLNQRHYGLLLTLEQKLQIIAPMVQQEPIAYELASYHIADAITHLSELTGKTITEQGMDAIFRTFCIGK